MSLRSLLRRIFNPNTTEYWDAVYASELAAGNIRQAETLVKIVPLVRDRKRILDFGGGPGGNLKLLSRQLRDTSFSLVDLSPKAVAFARDVHLGEQDGGTRLAGPAGQAAEDPRGRRRSDLAGRRPDCLPRPEHRAAVSTG